MTETPFLRVSSLHKTFMSEGKTVRALDGFSLEAARDSFTAIAGVSGCGKTTFLKCAAGLETPDSGALEFSGPHKTGVMFQDPRLLPWLTVEENVRLALEGKPAGNFAPGPPQSLSGEIAGALAMVGLDGRAQAYPRELSGGMAQRASLARCLCRKPQLLLLDEPLSALDAFTRKKLRLELDGLRRRLKLTAILVTHDIEEAVFLADNVVLMNAGRDAALFPVPLPFPRDCRGAAFQELCEEISRAAETIMEDKAP
jgi:ABC-type nitrate/sulfonate/bicarbonate transport system ATPase subunit